MNRKQFFQQSIIAGATRAVAPQAYSHAQDKDPKLDKTIVQEFVGAGHRDLDKVKQLLGEHPTLLNAAHDWKYGDFETCLGAACHVGHKELATFLIEQGAQANIFTAALFGHIAIIKPYLAAFPAALYAKGPHGFTLLHHADRGGHEALEVKEHLLSLGATEMKVALY